MKPKIYQTKGLKILICNNPENLSTASLILVKTGTDWERKEINGIAHFIEHLYFKGTKNFPTPKILMENIDKLGGIYNAFTSHQYTGFYIKVLPEFIKEAIFILSDIILNPLFPEEEIEKERKVIFEEINLYQDSPSQLVVDLGNKLTFGDQPAGWSILGTKETISKIKRKDIIEFVSKNYSRKNTLIILAGKIEREKDLIMFLEEKFKNYNSKNPPRKKEFKNPKNLYQEEIFNKEVEQGHIFIGFPVKGYLKLKEKRFIYSLLSLILGEKSSSRLWLKIREELGAAYYIRTHFIDYFDRGLFFVHAGINLDKLEDILENLVKEIIKFKKEGPTKEETLTAKAILKSSLFMNLEESLGSAFFYGYQYLMENDLKTPKEISKKIDLIQEKEIKSESQKIFLFKKVKFVLILPKNYKKKNFSSLFKKL